MRKNAVCADGKYFFCNSTTPNFCYQRIFDYESCTKINGRGDNGRTIYTKIDWSKK